MADWERGDVMRGAGREITKVLNIKAVAAVHKREGILACTLGCCLVCVLLLLCYQICGIRLGFWNFRNCPMEYNIMYFTLPFWGYVLLINFWIIVFTAGHALVLSALLSGKMKSLKAGGTCAITSVVFIAATVWTCKYFLFVTEKIPLVCPEVLYLVLLGIVVRTVIKRHGTA